MENRYLTQRYEVTKSPTIKVFGKNKNEPVDYTGHRQRSELVKFANDYAMVNEYVDIFTPPEPSSAMYWYNIESIVKDIADAHTTRTKDAETYHEAALDDVKGQGVVGLKSVRRRFD